MNERGGGVLVRRLGPEDADRVTGTLADSFRDYPVMRFVLAHGSATYEADLEVLVRFFVMSRILRGEWVLGVDQGGVLAAAALVSDPGGAPSPMEVAELREETWGRLGPAARSRYEAFGATVRPLLVEVPRLHLNMIGVRKSFRGRGLARTLLDRVHELSRSVPAPGGVSLTTEDPANLPLYEYFGYRLTGHARVSPELATWALFRAEPSVTGGPGPPWTPTRAC